MQKGEKNFDISASKIPQKAAGQGFCSVFNPQFLDYGRGQRTLFISPAMRV
jgi:hypothetical protein